MTQPEPIADGQLRNGDGFLGRTIDAKHRERKEAFVIAIEGEAFMGFLLKHPAAKQKKDQARERIAIARARARNDLVEALAVDRRETERDGDIQCEAALSKGKSGRPPIIRRAVDDR